MPHPTPSRVYIQVNGVDAYSDGIRSAGVAMIHPLEDVGGGAY